MSPDWAARPTTVPYAKFGDPQSLNLYSYVENGPINRIDVDGHSVFDDPFGTFSSGDTGFSNIQSHAGSGAAPIRSGDIKGEVEVTHHTGSDPHEGTGGDFDNESGASTASDENADMVIQPPRETIAQGGKGERGKTGRPDGTDDAFKKMKPDPDDPNKVIFDDPHTGKKVKKPKPPGFDDYWKKKHPPKEQPKPSSSPTPSPSPSPTPETTSPKRVPLIDWDELKFEWDAQWSEFKRRFNNGENLCPCKH
jgi:hypothetical protein